MHNKQLKMRIKIKPSLRSDCYPIFRKKLDFSPWIWLITCSRSYILLYILWCLHNTNYSLPNMKADLIRMLRRKKLNIDSFPFRCTEKLNTLRNACNVIIIFIPIISSWLWALSPVFYFSGNELLSGMVRKHTCSNKKQHIYCGCHPQSPFSIYYPPSSSCFQIWRQQRHIPPSSAHINIICFFPPATYLPGGILAVSFRLPHYIEQVYTTNYAKKLSCDDGHAFIYPTFLH